MYCVSGGFSVWFKSKLLMKYIITTDTHFGHEKIVTTFAEREKGFELKQLRAIEDAGINNKGATLIHLGDICIGKDEHWHEELKRHTLQYARKILVRGNHDNKSYNWYYEHGWDFVCETMRMRFMGKELLFSHMPILAEETETTLYHNVDMNIHGHLHGRGKYSHRAVEGYAAGFHYDCAPSEHDLKPIDLEKIIK